MNREDNSFGRYKPIPGNPRSLSDSGVISYWEDRSGVLWFGTLGDGVNILFPWVRKFPLYQHNPNDPDSLGANAVNGILEDRQGFIWFTLTAAGLSRLDPEIAESISRLSNGFDYTRILSLLPQR